MGSITCGIIGEFYEITFVVWSAVWNVKADR